MKDHCGSMTGPPQVQGPGTWDDRRLTRPSENLSCSVTPQNYKSNKGHCRMFRRSNA